MAAIVSLLASMKNSISTIFTMDIYRDDIARNKGERHHVMVGRIAARVSMVLAPILARPFLGGMESAFQTVQEYSGFIAPGVVAIFLLCYLFRQANPSGAFAVLIAIYVIYWSRPSDLRGRGGVQFEPAALFHIRKPAAIWRR